MCKLNFADIIPFLFLQFYSISTKSSPDSISEYSFKLLHWIIIFNDILEWRFSDLIAINKRRLILQKGTTLFFSVMVICSQHLLPHQLCTPTIFWRSFHCQCALRSRLQGHVRTVKSNVVFVYFSWFHTPRTLILWHSLNMLSNMLTEIPCCRARFLNIQR